MASILSVLPVFIVLFVVVSIVRAAVKAAQQQAASQQGKVRPSPANFDPAAAERTRRIQEEIRRKIAERRGRPATAARPVESVPPPLPRDDSSSAAPGANSGPSATAVANAAVLKRQEQLADQMRALEAARLAERRKASELATVVRETDKVAASAAVARKELLSDLRTPTTLRRVILLREVLGPPVGLR